jgi:hypothetical protein
MEKTPTLLDLVLVIGAATIAVPKASTIEASDGETTWQLMASRESRSFTKD